MKVLQIAEGVEAPAPKKPYVVKYETGLMVSITKKSSGFVIKKYDQPKANEVGDYYEVGDYRDDWILGGSNSSPWHGSITLEF